MLFHSQRLEILSYVRHRLLEPHEVRVARSYDYFVTAMNEMY